MGECMQVALYVRSAENWCGQGGLADHKQNVAWGDVETLGDGSDRAMNFGGEGGQWAAGQIEQRPPLAPR